MGTTIPLPKDEPATIGDLNSIFFNIVNIALAFAGIAFFILLILGGFKYMTAGGEAPKVEAAKKTLTSALAGLVLILLSYLILVVIEEITGAPITGFNVILPNIR